jgi:hypothetical protein
MAPRTNSAKTTIVAVVTHDPWVNQGRNGDWVKVNVTLSGFSNRFVHLVAHKDADEKTVKALPALVKGDVVIITEGFIDYDNKGKIECPCIRVKALS